MRKESKNKNIAEANRLAEMEYMKGREEMGIPSNPSDDQPTEETDPLNRTYTLDDREVDITDMGYGHDINGNEFLDNLFWVDNNMDLEEDDLKRFTEKYPELYDYYMSNIYDPSPDDVGPMYETEETGANVEEKNSTEVNENLSNEINEIKAITKRLLGE